MPLENGIKNKYKCARLICDAYVRYRGTYILKWIQASGYLKKTAYDSLMSCLPCYPWSYEAQKFNKNLPPNGTMQLLQWFSRQDDNSTS